MYLFNLGVKGLILPWYIAKKCSCGMFVKTSGRGRGRRVERSNRTLGWGFGWMRRWGSGWSRTGVTVEVRATGPGQTVLPTQANSSQVHNFDGVGDRLATHLAWVGSSWQLAWIWSSSDFPPTRARFSTVKPPRPNQANSYQVILL